MPQAAKNFQVAIVGGGVCGLTCAIALAKLGVPVQIYEAAASFGEIGAGLGIGSNAVKILKELGVLESVFEKAGIDPDRKLVYPPWFRVISGMGEHEDILDYKNEPDEGSIGLHRAAFLDALVEHIDPDTVHFHKRCVSVVSTEDRKLNLVFADGTDAVADVVLGADGIKSAVRGAVNGIPTTETLAYSHTACFRGLITLEALRSAGVTRVMDERPLCYVGKDRHLIVFAIMGGAIINIAAFSAKYDVALGEGKLLPDAPTVEQVTTEQLLKEYEGWGPEVVGLLSCIQEPNKWLINVVHPHLDSYARGRVAVLGDAAHGMLPHLGAGAGQGIEDANILAKLLGHPQTTLENVEAALQVYDEVRRPRAQSVWEGSVRAGRIFDGHGPSGPTPEGVRKDLAGIWDMVWRRDLHAEEQRAVRILQERGVFAASRL